MDKLNAFATAPGADFYDAFKAADPGNGAIDSEIAEQLKNNPDGIEFSYGGKDYVLAKDTTTNKYTLHQQTPSGKILKDENVQIDTKFAPDGFVEIGGLSKVGTRLFIGRAPDNVEQVIAFEGAHDTSSVLFRPENAVVLYDGSKKPEAEKPEAEKPEAEKPEAEKPAAEPEQPAAEPEQPAAEPEQPAAETEQSAAETEQPAAETEQPAAETEQPAAETEQPAAETGQPTTPTGTPIEGSEAPDDVIEEPTASDNTDEAASVPTNLQNSSDYISPRDLPEDGKYEVRSDGGWYNSAGEKIGMSFCISGNYEVKNGEFSRALNSGELIPASPVTGYYLMGSSFTSQAGVKQEVTFEILQQGGAKVDEIAFDTISPDAVDGEGSLIVIDGVELVANSDGTVLGTPSYLWFEAA